MTDTVVAASVRSRRGERMVTMKDVADKAGVSTSTVSRVLNGKERGRIKPDIAKEVRRQAKLLGYKPNPVARSLRTHSSRILGFVSDEISTTPFSGRIMLGAQDAARELGYILLAVNTGNDPDLEAQEIDAIKRYGADGFLYAMMYNRQVAVPRSLDGVPAVLIDAWDEDGERPSISPDERRIGRDATERLLRAGCRRIMYVGADVPLVAQHGRLAGYREALESAGIGADGRLVVAVDEQDTKGEFRRAFEAMRPDGVFCFNDVRANLVYRAAEDLGRTIGRDLSVIGVDNQPFIAGILSPSLSSIELPHYEMGYWGVRKLVSLIEDRDIDEGSLEHAPGTHTGDSAGSVAVGANDTSHGGVHAQLPSLKDDQALIGCVLVDKKSIVA